MEVPIFAGKVNFLELMRTKGESYIEWANRMNQQSELANLEGIKAHEILSGAAQDRQAV